jgi:hypothetical protein
VQSAPYIPRRREPLPHLSPIEVVKTDDKESRGEFSISRTDSDSLSEHLLQSATPPGYPGGGQGPPTQQGQPQDDRGLFSSMMGAAGGHNSHQQVEQGLGRMSKLTLRGVNLYSSRDKCHPLQRQWHSSTSEELGKIRYVHKKEYR